MFKLIESVLTLPVAAVADVVTIGGALNDRDEPYTVSKVRKIVEDVEEIADVDTRRD